MAPNEYKKSVFFQQPVARSQEKIIDEPGTKDAFTQSDYREMDTQTDPFTPEYVLREDDPNPMVLALADMHFETGENGGRIGLDEIKFIDKTRRRRQVEENLPSGTEKEQFDKRVQMLKELEMKEWEEREEEIQKQQDAEMEILERVLRQREHDREQRNRKKLEKRKA